MSSQKSLAYGLEGEWRVDDIVERLSKIKLLILDVDGVLTDGSLYFFSKDDVSRVYNVQDGYGVQLLAEAGFQMAVISAGTSPKIKERWEPLGIQNIHLGKQNKLDAFHKVLNKLELEPVHAAYIADDLFDIPILEKVGFAATVPHSPLEVKKRVHYITQREGGRGAVRELIDGLRRVQKIGPYIEEEQITP